MAVNVRRGRPEDADDIVSSNMAMALETESRELDRSTLAKGVRTLLASPDKGFYVVAEVDGKHAGCLLMTVEWSDWNNGEYWWFQSVYVKPELRKRKVFSSMFNYVEELAKTSSNVAQLRLYTKRDNTVAKATYNHLGMHHSQYDMFEKDLAH